MIIFYDEPSGDVVGYLEGFDANPEIGVDPGPKYDKANIKSLNINQFHTDRKLVEELERPDVHLTPYDFKVVTTDLGVVLQYKNVL